MTPCAVTALARVVHPSENVDERRLYVLQDPGPFTLADLPRGLRSGIIHLAGISDHEFTLEFIRDLKSAGYALSLDMQSFVRVIGAEREIIFSDFPAKRELAALLDVVKLDVVEAEILTGTRDLARAAAIFAEWGAKEVLITERQGAVLAAEGAVQLRPLHQSHPGGPHRARRHHHQRLSLPPHHAPPRGRAALRRRPGFAENGNPRAVYREHGGGRETDAWVVSSEQ